jgi:protein ImuB
MNLKGAQRLVGLSPAAARAGLASGMTLAAARALVPELVVADADAGAEQADLEALARWATRWTPWAAPARAACSGGAALMLDVTGCAHLFGGEQALLDDIAFKLRRLGLSVGLAMASTPGAAWALATHHPHAGTGLVVQAGAVRAAVMGLPVEALRIDAAQAHGLRALGLKRIGAVAGLAPAAIARRFGAGLVRALDRALGVEDEVVNPLAQVLPCRVRLAAGRAPDEPGRGWRSGWARRWVNWQPCWKTAARVPARCRSVSTVSMGCCLPCQPGPPAPIATRQSGPGFCPTACRAMGRSLISAFGVDLIEAAVPVLEPMIGETVDLDPVAAAAMKSADAVHRLAERLSARIGASRVSRMVAVDSWVPEKTQVLVSAVASSPKRGLGEVVGRTGGGVWHKQALSLASTPSVAFSDSSPASEGAGTGRRPPLLLATPEPVDAIAEVPDGPPRLFRWRRQPFKVTRADGPERLICDSPEPRDYYCVETDQGRRFWMFRQGLPGTPPAHLPQQEEPRPPRWYLHATG